MLQAFSPCACAPELPTALHTHTRACSPIKQLYQRDSQTDGQTLFTIHTYIHGPDTYMYSTHSFARTLLYPPGIELRRRRGADSYSLYTRRPERVSHHADSVVAGVSPNRLTAAAASTQPPPRRVVSLRERVYLAPSRIIYFLGPRPPGNQGRSAIHLSLARSLARAREYRAELRQREGRR